MKNNKGNLQGRFTLEKNKDSKKDGMDSNSLTEFKRTSLGEEDLQTVTSGKNAEGVIADITILWGRTVMVRDGQVEMTTVTEGTETTETTSSTTRTTMEPMGTRVSNRGII